jgi:allophanate hydrolase subunit 2
MTAGPPRRIRVRRPGALTTIQDCGRPGFAHLGVGYSGALDGPAHHQANRLVGNAPGAAVLETTLTGVAIVAQASVTAAVTGARAAVRVDGELVDGGLVDGGLVDGGLVDGGVAAQGRVVVLRPGQVLDVGPARPGVRSYVAFSGGIQVPPVLGSRSTDLLSGLGPPPLAAGDLLLLGDADTDPGTRPRCRAADLAAGPVPGDRAELLIHLGPRHDWLSAAGLAALSAGTWTVSPVSNRVALRLAGTPVQRGRLGELPSEGLVTGGIQALPDGQLVLFLADHPTTGGYPVIAVLDPASLGACAQARPGMPVSFRLAAMPDWAGKP